MLGMQIKFASFLIEICKPEKTMARKKLIDVESCIKRVEESGYKLTNRGKFRNSGPPVYVFRNENAEPAFREFVFSISELRCVYHFGW